MGMGMGMENHYFCHDSADFRGTRGKVDIHHMTRVRCLDATQPLYMPTMWCSVDALATQMELHDHRQHHQHDFYGSGFRGRLLKILDQEIRMTSTVTAYVFQNQFRFII